MSMEKIQRQHLELSMLLHLAKTGVTNSHQGMQEAFFLMAKEGVESIEHARVIWRKFRKVMPRASASDVDGLLDESISIAEISFETESEVTESESQDPNF